jgi:hypothetical protein
MTNPTSARYRDTRGAWHELEVRKTAAARIAMTPLGHNDGLVVVNVREVVNPILAGHEGRAYTSPPQPREQALALVAVLLRSPTPPGERNNGGGWSRPIVGGRLQITLDDQ